MVKKKTFLASLGSLLVFAIVFSAFTPSFASFKGIETNALLKETDRNFYYGLLFMKLIDTFPKVLTPTEYGEKEVAEYPPEYAGAYVDKSDTLHILLTKTADITTKNNYQEIMDNDEEIIFEIVDFPLSSLYEIQRSLDIEVMEEFGIVFAGLNETANKVQIHMLDSNKEKDYIEFLENKFNDFDPRCIIVKDPIEFKLSGTDTASNALAGSYTYTSTIGGTVGFNGFRVLPTGLQFGVVTAGHVATLGSTVMNSFGTTIGSTSISQFSGTVDAGFVPFSLLGPVTQSYEISGLASPDDRITHYYPDDEYLYIGMPVDKRGDVTGTTSGTIILTSTIANFQGVAFSDQAYVTNSQALGDSGAPVYRTYSQVGTDFHVLLGIATFSEVGTGYALISKVGNIRANLGVTPMIYPT